jgi:alpha-N-arabinofuranosidase
MYRNHMRSQLALMNIRCDEWKVPSRDGSATMPGISGSASVNGKTLTVTLTNPSLDAAVTARIRLAAGSIVEGRGSVLTHPEMTAGDTLDRPNEVTLASFPVNVRGSRAGISIPKHSIVALELKMA